MHQRIPWIWLRAVGNAIYRAIQHSLRVSGDVPEGISETGNAEEPIRYSLHRTYVRVIIYEHRFQR